VCPVLNEKPSAYSAKEKLYVTKDEKIETHTHKKNKS
jgi:hypothetical protein